MYSMHKVNYFVTVFTKLSSTWIFKRLSWRMLISEIFILFLFIHLLFFFKHDMIIYLGITSYDDIFCWLIIVYIFILSNSITAVNFLDPRIHCTHRTNSGFTEHHSCDTVIYVCMLSNHGLHFIKSLKNYTFKWQTRTHN